jgi:hypothetical protein
MGYYNKKDGEAQMHQCLYAIKNDKYSCKTLTIFCSTGMAGPSRKEDSRRWTGSARGNLPGLEVFKNLFKMYRIGPLHVYPGIAEYISGAFVERSSVIKI